MWQWILNNSAWLIPLVIVIGDLAVRMTKTEVDNDIWKRVSYVLSLIFNVKNRDKQGNDIPVYSKEELKPKDIQLLDRIAKDLKNRVERLKQQIKKKQ